MDGVLLAVALPGAAFVALAYGEQFARGFNGIVYALTPRRWRR